MLKTLMDSSEESRRGGFLIRGCCNERDLVDNLKDWSDAPCQSEALVLIIILHASMPLRV